MPVSRPSHRAHVRTLPRWGARGQWPWSSRSWGTFMAPYGRIDPRRSSLFMAPGVELRRTEVAYHASAGLGAAADETPWCASFINWRSGAVVVIHNAHGPHQPDRHRQRTAKGMVDVRFRLAAQAVDIGRANLADCPALTALLDQGHRPPCSALCGSQGRYEASGAKCPCTVPLQGQSCGEPPAAGSALAPTWRSLFSVWSNTV